MLLRRALGDAGWCKECEQLYDRWVRRHASRHRVAGARRQRGRLRVGVGLPLLGVGWLVAAVGAFAGFGTFFGLSRVTRRRRRTQFLQAPLPRAYLPAPK